MGRLAGFNGSEVMRVAESDGWKHVRTNGDHFIPIPDHREMKEGTLRDIVRTLQITPDDFIRRAKVKPDNQPRRSRPGA